MNNCIKKVLFGNQKQSLRQNVAIVNFVEEYLTSSDQPYSLNTEEQVCQAIEREVNFLCNNKPEAWYISDKLFLQYILGMEGWNAISQNVPGQVLRHEVGENGKVVFTYCPMGEHSINEWSDERRKAALIARKENDSWNSVNKNKAASKEDEAWALVEKIIKSVPPARREQVPEDDALAAVVLSQEYWRVND